MIQLSRDGKKVSRLVIYWEAKCTSGKGFPDFYGILVATDKPPSSQTQPGSGNPYFGKPIGKSGRFKGTSVGALDLGPSPSGGNYVGVLSQEISGKLGSSKGAGTWQAHLEVVDTQTGQKADDCDTGSLRWKAAKPQTLFYGGTTSQAAPVVVELSRDRRSVRVFRIGWSAPCAAPGSPPGDTPFTFGDAIETFPIKRGKFGDTFSTDINSEGGTKIKLEYEITGTVGRTKAKGSFHVRVTATDASGATIEACDSPRITWNAKQ